MALTNPIGVPSRRINEIVLGKRAATADTDMRLTHYWGLSKRFVLGLQFDRDLLEQQRKKRPALETITRRAA